MNFSGEMNGDETEIHIQSSMWKKKNHKEFKRVGPFQMVSFGREKKKKMQISCSEVPEGKAAPRAGAPAYFLLP